MDSLASFYEVLARNAASAAKGVQRNELREGLRRLQIGLTNAQLDRLVATVRVDQFGGISFDEFSQWLHVRDSDASIIVGSSVLCVCLSRSSWSHSSTSVLRRPQPTCNGMRTARGTLGAQAGHRRTEPRRKLPATGAGAARPPPPARNWLRRDADRAPPRDHGG